MFARLESGEEPAGAGGAPADEEVALVSPSEYDEGGPPVPLGDGGDLATAERERREDDARTTSTSAPVVRSRGVSRAVLAAVRPGPFAALAAATVIQVCAGLTYSFGAYSKICERRSAAASQPTRAPRHGERRGRVLRLTRRRVVRPMRARGDASRRRVRAHARVPGGVRRARRERPVRGKGKRREPVSFVRRVRRLRVLPGQLALRHRRALGVHAVLPGGQSRRIRGAQGIPRAELGGVSAGVRDVRALPPRARRRVVSAATTRAIERRGSCCSSPSSAARRP